MTRIRAKVVPIRLNKTRVLHYTFCNFDTREKFIFQLNAPMSPKPERFLKRGRTRVLMAWVSKREDLIFKKLFEFYFDFVNFDDNTILFAIQQSKSLL